MYRSSGNGVRGSIPSSVGIVSNIERPSSPDVAMGAYLMTHLQQRCENCLTSETPQWRKGWFSNLLNRSVVLCNACGLKFNKNQFCPYCMYVYYKEEDRKQTNTWVICRTCHRWVHMTCESQYGDGGFHFNLATNLNGTNSMHKMYHCPSCRESSSTNSSSVYDEEDEESENQAIFIDEDETSNTRDARSHSHSYSHDRSHLHGPIQEEPMEL